MATVMALRGAALAGVVLLVGGHAVAQSTPLDREGAEDGAPRAARQAIAVGPCSSAVATLAAPSTAMPSQDAGIRHRAYVRVLVRGCGGAEVLNYVVATLADGRRSAITMLPGTTAADPLLQMDVLTPVLAAGRARAAADCREGRVVATAFGGPAPRPGEARMTHSWRGTWVVDACGPRTAVPVAFTPNERGTRFDIRASEVRRLN